MKRIKLIVLHMQTMKIENENKPFILLKSGR